MNLVQQKKIIIMEEKGWTPGVPTAAATFGQKARVDLLAEVQGAVPDPAIPGALRSEHRG